MFPRNANGTLREFMVNSFACVDLHSCFFVFLLRVCFRENKLQKILCCICLTVGHFVEDVFHHMNNVEKEECSSLLFLGTTANEVYQ